MKITRKVIVTTFSYGITTVVGFLGTIYFTNTLGAALFGKYVLGITIVKWLIISDFGFRKATIKRISEGKKINQFYTASLLVHFVQAAFVIMILSFLRGRVNNYVGGDFFSLILILFMSILIFELFGMGINGVNQVHVFKSIDAFSQVARVGFQSALIIFGYELAGLFIGHTFALCAAALVASYFLIFRCNIRLAIPTRDQFISLFTYAKFSWLARIRSQTFARMDVAVMGFFVASSAVATYQVAWTISMVFGVLSQSIQENLFPEISELDVDNRVENIQLLVEEGLVYAVFVPVVGLFGSFVLGRDVLAIFGPEFVEGVPLLIILAALSVISTIDGQLRNAINSLDLPEYTFRINALFILMNISLNVIFIHYFDAIGAAIASLISIIVSTVYALSLLRTIISVSIPWKTIFSQIFAGSVMAGILWSIKLFFLLDGPLATFTLAGAGAIIYVLILMLISQKIRTKILEIYIFS